MKEASHALDLLARRLMHATEEDLRRWLQVTQLDYELLGTLYLRVRETLERAEPVLDDDAIEELVLTIYLTASAWQSRSEAPTDVLLSLRSAIAETLNHETEARRKP